MTVSTIGGTDTTANNTIQTTTLGQQDFLKVLLAQLSYQDPLKPLDNQQFIAQMAQFSALEAANQTNSRLDLLLTIQGAVQTLGLIGKTVQVTTSSGTAQVGNVTTVTFNGTQPLLTVQIPSGQFLTNVDVSQVSLVR